MAQGSSSLQVAPKPVADLEHKTSLRVNMSASLLRSFDAAVTLQGIQREEACRRIVLGLWGLNDADLRSLPEPPNELRNRYLGLRIDWRYLDELCEISKCSRLTIPSILRRIFHGILVTHTIHFVFAGKEGRICLRITQTHIDYADDFERDGISPLLSRQHREIYD